MVEYTLMTDSNCTQAIVKISDAEARKASRRAAERNGFLYSGQTDPKYPVMKIYVRALKSTTDTEIKVSTAQSGLDIKEP
jgi:hypothetical protein